MTAQIPAKPFETHRPIGRAEHSAVSTNVRLVENTYAPGRRQEKHAHPYASISIVLAGSVSEAVGDKVEDAFPLSVVIKPLDTEHTDRFGSGGARLFSLQVEQAFVESLHESELKLGEWRWVHGGPATSWMLRLLQAQRRPTSRDKELEDLVYEILASLPTTKSPRAVSPPQWLERVKQELDETFCQGVRVRDLATQASVHPVYLARQFRHYVGCSITDYRMFLKVRAAAQVLASTGVPLATAAHECGFADQSHLGRAFKTASGLTPGKYRRLTSTSHRQAA